MQTFIEQSYEYDNDVATRGSTNNATDIANSKHFVIPAKNYFQPRQAIDTSTMLMNHKQCNYRQVFDTIAVKIKATKRDRVDAMWQ